MERALSPELIRRLVPNSVTEEELQTMKETLGSAGAANGSSPAVSAAAAEAERPLATRELPPRPATPRERIHKSITDPEVRADIDEMTTRGLARIAAGADEPVPSVIDKLHRYIDGVRAGTTKLGAKAGVARLELACAFAEQLHRAFAWQWTQTPHGVAIASPTGSHAIHLTALFERLAKKGGRTNTLALLFNMLAAGELPASKRGAFLSIS